MLKRWGPVHSAAFRPYAYGPGPAVRTQMLVMAIWATRPLFLNYSPHALGEPGVGLEVGWAGADPVLDSGVVTLLEAFRLAPPRGRGGARVQTGACRGAWRSMM